MGDAGTHMSKWMNFLDSLATKGGGIFMLFALLIIGCVMIYLKIASGDTVVHDSFIGILAVLGASRLNNGK